MCVKCTYTACRTKVMHGRKFRPPSWVLGQYTMKLSQEYYAIGTGYLKRRALWQRNWVQLLTLNTCQVNFWKLSRKYSWKYYPSILKQRENRTDLWFKEFHILCMSGHVPQATLAGINSFKQHSISYFQCKTLDMRKLLSNKGFDLAFFK